MSGLTCVVGGKGAPGATTLALALALTVRSTHEDPVVLVDADPDGGDMAARLGLPSSPGLVTLAAAARRGLDTEDIFHSTRDVFPGVQLLAAPSSPEQSSSSLMALRRALAAVLDGRTSVVDVGRWTPRSPASDLVAAATAAVLVIHPSLSGVAHARYQFEQLATACPNVVVACLGSRPYDESHVADVLGTQQVVALPVDRHGAHHLFARPRSDRWLRRSPLLRASRAIVESLGEVEEALA